MKPSLQLRIGQQLTMTPQLQQAIKLLQLSTLDLQAEIQQILESNPMLDRQEEFGESQVSEKESKDESQVGTDEALNNEKIDTDLPVDTQWDDWQATPSYSSGPRMDEDREFEFQGKTTESLQDHLLWQMQLTPFTENDELIATTLIDAIDEEGYLRSTPEEVLEAINEGVSDEEERIELDEVIAVLHRIQQFDPPGVAARDLRECLLLQLKQFTADTPHLSNARKVVENHIKHLGNRNYKQIMRLTHLSEDELRDALQLIQSLNPRPGSAIASGEPEYVIPDVFVSKKNGRWSVELNPDCAPRLKINADYASLIRRADSSADNTFLRNNLQEAKWFLKSLVSRNETLLKVATCIVEKQLGFFEEGEEAMQPLVLHDVAEEVGMHESTISRVTTQKYMHTPRGIFELKYFFSSHVSTATGGECSSTAIRALIKKLIAAEDAKKPLSDSKIANLLKEQGIKVARRTIAKYREAMAIPPSNERKSLL